MVQDKKIKPSSIVKITRALLDFLEEVVYTTEVAFSRDSLSRKMMRLDPEYREWEVRKSLRQLEASGYIRQRGDSFSISKKGEQYIDYRKLNRLSFDPASRPWDHQWRLIMFDIPEKKRNIRDTFRAKMKEWQCTKLQHSIFVTPYSCDAELKQLIKLLSAESYVYVITVPSIGEHLTKRFKSKYQLP